MVPQLLDRPVTLIPVEGLEVKDHLAHLIQLQTLDLKVGVTDESQVVVRLLHHMVPQVSEDLVVLAVEDLVPEALAVGETSMEAITM